MRLRQVTLMTSILLGMSWDGHAQKQYPQQGPPAESGKDASQVVTQKGSALAGAAVPVTAAADPLHAAIATPGQSLHDTFTVYTPRDFGWGHSATQAMLASNELPEAPQPQPARQNAIGPVPSSADGANLSGLVLDASGAVVVEAEVTLSKADGSQGRTEKTKADGSFTFTDLPSGSYFVNVHAKGFDIFTSDPVVLAAQQSYDLPKIVLTIAGANTEVTVRPASEVAAAQIKAEEKQRVFGIVPAYFTSYVYDAAPLTSRQKFSLAAHDTFDPVSFVGVGIAAGIQQANNSFRGYGQGAAGYGKRYGAALGDSLSSDFLGHAVFPSLLHQDPRYFYQGSGSAKSRFVHAVSYAVVTRNDKGGLMPNYSYLLGDLGSGALSNLYYPHADRGAGLVFTNAAIGMGGRAAGSVFREFLSKRVTTNVPGDGKP